MHSILIIIFSSVAFTIVWWVFFREKIGYKAPNHLFCRATKMPPRLIALWLGRLCIMISIMSIIIGPTREIHQYTLQKQQQHILFVLDISRSMLAEDISPSRIEVAKNLIKRYISERKDDVFGLVVFAGRGYISLPFSQDTRGMSAILEHITPYYIRQDLPGLSGTAIGDALLESNTLLSSMDTPSTIILITDGRNNVGIDPRIAALETQSLSIPIYSIGIGANTGVPLSYRDPETGKIVQLTEEGKPIETDIDEELLQSISQDTGGEYYRIEQAQEIYTHLDRINASMGGQESMSESYRTLSLRPYFLVLLIILLVIERVASNAIFYKRVQSEKDLLF